MLSHFVFSVLFYTMKMLQNLCCWLSINISQFIVTFNVTFKIIQLSNKLFEGLYLPKKIFALLEATTGKAVLYFYVDLGKHFNFHVFSLFLNVCSPISLNRLDRSRLFASCEEYSLVGSVRKFFCNCFL